MNYKEAGGLEDLRGGFCGIVPLLRLLPHNARGLLIGNRRHRPPRRAAGGMLRRKKSPKAKKNCVRRACSCCYCTEMPVSAAPHAQVMPSGHCLAQHISQRGPEGHWGSAKAPQAIFFNAGPEGPQAPGPEDLRAWTWG